MELFIKIVDGLTIDHPVLGENLLQAFSDFDKNTNNYGYVEFHRVEPPAPTTVYHIVEHVGYTEQDGVYKDTYTNLEISPEEKQAMIDEVISTSTFPSWVFDESSCTMQPPIPYPTDATVPYDWDEESLQWVEINLEPNTLP